MKKGREPPESGPEGHESGVGIPGAIEGASGVTAGGLQQNQAMKHAFLLFAGTAIAALAALDLPCAAADTASLTIHTAIEVEFPTAKGRLYQLQGSSNLTDWASIGDPVFGSGRPVNRVFSTRTGAEVVFQSYRLETTEVTDTGFAPWSLAGLRLQLDDRSDADLVVFSSETEGTAREGDDDTFTYELTRLDLNTVVADLRRDDQRNDLLTLTFTATDRGTWVRDEFRKGRLKDRDVGVFRIVAAGGSGTNTPPVDPVGPGGQPVASLDGRTFVFQDGETPDRLVFGTGSTGTELGDDLNDDEPNRFGFSYEVTGDHTARLVVTFKPGRYDEYDLTFASDAQGRFVRREFRDGRLKDTDRGSFSEETASGGSGGGGNTGGSGGTGEVGQPPKDTLSGLTYTMREGEDTDVLVFSSSTTGTETGDDVGDDEPNIFGYTYTGTGETTARLVVTFKADRWDEYDLTFVQGQTGTFVRREFKEGVLNDTDTGRFSGASTVVP